MLPTSEVAGPSTDIAGWLAEARAGDPEAFGYAMEACRNYLLLVADQELNRGLRARGGVSDIVQETFLDAQRGFKRFDGRSESELRSWLRRILKNNLVSFIRRHRQLKRNAAHEVPLGRAGASDDWRREPTARTVTPSNHAIQREQTQALARGLAQLPERQRQVIQWRHHEHCPFEEIGRRLGISSDAARMTWARAIKRLQQDLGISEKAPEVGEFRS